MKVEYHKKFLKIFKNLPIKIKNKFYERLLLLEKDPYHPLLNNHSIDPIYPGWRSINITGDYRALYEQMADNHVKFMRIGTHSELY